MQWKSFLLGLGLSAVALSLLFYNAYRIELKTIAPSMTEDQIIEQAARLGMIRVKDLPDAITPSPLPDDEIIRLAAQLGMIFATDTSSPEPTIDSSENIEIASSTSVIAPSSPPPQATPTITPAPSATLTPTPAAPDTSGALPEGFAFFDGGDYYRVTIPQGMDSGTICIFLQRVGLVQNAQYFNRYLTQKGLENRMRWGEFSIPKDSVTADGLLAILTG